MLLFLALLFSPAWACLNSVNVDDFEARRLCGEQNAGDFSKCRDKKLPACNTGKCFCIPLDVPTAAIVGVEQNEATRAWVPIVSIAKEQAERDAKAEQAQRAALRARALEAVLAEKQAAIVAEDLAKTR